MTDDTPSAPKETRKTPRPSLSIYALSSRRCPSSSKGRKGLAKRVSGSSKASAHSQGVGREGADQGRRTRGRIRAGCRDQARVAHRRSSCGCLRRDRSRGGRSSTRHHGADAEVLQVRKGMFGVKGSGDTSGYGGLTRVVEFPAAADPAVWRLVGPGLRPDWRPDPRTSAM